MFDTLADCIGKLASDASNELKQHYRLVVFLLFLSFALSAPDIVGYVYGANRMNNTFLFIAFGLTLVALAARYLFFVICLILVPSNLAYLHVYRHWGITDLDSRMEAAIESPTGESLEYLQSHLDFIDYAAILFSIIYFILLIRVIIRSRNHLKALGKIAGVALIVWVLVFVAFRGDRKLRNYPAPMALVGETFRARMLSERLADRRANLAQQPLAIHECKPKYNKIVIVLGESALSDHMSVFGYPKDTTPFVNRSKPYVFDALAPSNQTRYSLPMLLTSARPGHFDVFYKEHSLVGQLRACGFHTLWISNQGRVGKYDSTITSIALEADEQIFLNELSFYEAKYDEQVVATLESRDVFNRSNQVTFVHLIGSHVAYGKRFPEHFGFTDRSDRVADYDNSLLYTDFILSELYKKFHDESLLFIYVSDHGEVVSNTTFGHGFSPSYKEEYRVPLLIWTNDSVAMEQVKSAIGNSKINTESVDNVVRFLTGISTAPRVSTSRSVMVLSHKVALQYDDLQSFDKD